MKTIASGVACTLLLTILFFSGVKAQKINAFNNNIESMLDQSKKYQGLFKGTLLVGFKKGASIGLSYGMWYEGPRLQYSLNTGLMLRTGKAFLGNYRNKSNPTDNRSKSQFVFMFTPMLSVNITKDNYYYQEIEPFYWGTPNAVFLRYAYSLTLGTTFTISPRGTYSNITTSRNRAQQDFMIALNVKNFNFTLYDDFFPFFTSKLQLGDNWDRFFTGGGFIRYRFNQQFTFHLYSEVYTGQNRPNAFISPDIISYKPKNKKWFRKNFANQDPGAGVF